MKTGSDFLRGLGVVIDRAAAREDALAVGHVASPERGEGGSAASTAWRNPGAGHGTGSAEGGGMHETSSQAPQTGHGQHQPLAGGARGSQAHESASGEGAGAANSAGASARRPHFAEVMAAGLADAQSPTERSQRSRSDESLSVKLPEELNADGNDDLVTDVLAEQDHDGAAALAVGPTEIPVPISDPVAGSVMASSPLSPAAAVAVPPPAVAADPQRAVATAPGSGQLVVPGVQARSTEVAFAPSTRQAAGALPSTPAQRTPRDSRGAVAGATTGDGEVREDRSRGAVPLVRGLSSPANSPVAIPGPHFAPGGERAVPAGQVVPARSAMPMPATDNMNGNAAAQLAIAIADGQLAVAADGAVSAPSQHLRRPASKEPSSQVAAAATPAALRAAPLPLVASVETQAEGSRHAAPPKVEDAATNQHAASPLPSPSSPQDSAPTAPSSAPSSLVAAPTVSTLSTTPLPSSAEPSIGRADGTTAGLEIQGAPPSNGRLTALRNGPLVATARSGGQKITRSELNRRTEARVAEVISTLTAEKTASPATAVLPGRWKTVIPRPIQPAIDDGRSSRAAEASPRHAGDDLAPPRQAPAVSRPGLVIADPSLAPAPTGTALLSSPAPTPEQLSAASRAANSQAVALPAVAPQETAPQTEGRPAPHGAADAPVQRTSPSGGSPSRPAVGSPRSAPVVAKESAALSRPSAGPAAAAAAAMAASPAASAGSTPARIPLVNPAAVGPHQPGTVANSHSAVSVPTEAPPSREVSQASSSGSSVAVPAQPPTRRGNDVRGRASAAPFLAHDVVADEAIGSPSLAHPSAVPAVAAATRPEMIPAPTPRPRFAGAAAPTHAPASAVHPGEKLVTGAANLSRAPKLAIEGTDLLPAAAPHAAPDQSPTVAEATPVTPSAPRPPKTPDATAAATPQVTRQAWSGKQLVASKPTPAVNDTPTAPSVPHSAEAPVLAAPVAPPLTASLSAPSAGGLVAGSRPAAHASPPAPVAQPSPAASQDPGLPRGARDHAPVLASPLSARAFASRQATPEPSVAPTAHNTNSADTARSADPGDTADHSRQGGSSPLAEVPQPVSADTAPVVSVAPSLHRSPPQIVSTGLPAPAPAQPAPQVPARSSGSGAPVAVNTLAHPMAPGTPPTVTPEHRILSRAAGADDAARAARTTSPSLASESPAASALTTRSPTIPTVPASPLPPHAVETRRVRAAVLELHHRLLPVESSNAGVPSSSRNLFDTPSRADKASSAANRLFNPSAAASAPASGTRLPTSVTPRFMKAASAASRDSSSAEADAGADDNRKTEAATASPPAVELLPRGRVAAPAPSPLAFPGAASPSLLASSGHAATSQTAGGTSLARPPGSAPSSGTDASARSALSDSASLSSSPATTSAASAASSSSGSSASSDDRERDQHSASSRAVTAEIARAAAPAAEKSVAQMGFPGTAGLSAAPTGTAIDLRAMGSLVPQGPPGTRPLMELAADDPSLHATALGKNAHVRLETANDGDLSLHLMVHDGVVDVRFDGAASRTLDIRSHEVRAALAGEGISLGTFEAATRSSSGQPSSSGASSGSSSSSGQSSGPDSGTGGAPASGHAAGGGATSSHNGSQLGGGGGHRHSEPGDRWPDREPSPTSSSSAAGRATAKDTQAEPRRRRGFHVTA